MQSKNTSLALDQLRGLGVFGSYEHSKRRPKLSRPFCAEPLFRQACAMKRRKARCRRGLTFVCRPWRVRHEQCIASSNGIPESRQ